jgi:hypothetical protein
MALFAFSHANTVIFDGTTVKTNGDSHLYIFQLVYRIWFTINLAQTSKTLHNAPRQTIDIWLMRAFSQLFTNLSLLLPIYPILVLLFPDHTLLIKARTKIQTPLLIFIIWTNLTAIIFATSKALLLLDIFLAFTAVVNSQRLMLCFSIAVLRANHWCLDAISKDIDHVRVKVVTLAKLSSET